MNVLLIGSGGREHALALKISESPKLTKLYCSPGNPGIEEISELVHLNINQHGIIIDFCFEKNIDLVVIGPEQPLVEGLADSLREKNIPVFGPNKDAAMIEGDKAFSKSIMKKYNIPTAEYEIFTKQNKENAITYLDKIDYPTVIKASGLAAGKGVAICASKEEAEDTIQEYFEENKFGESGHTIVIEEFMTGEEVSIFAVTDGRKYVLLPSSQDHKRALDGDKGKNTGGMGAYAPAPLVNNDLIEQVKKEIIEPTLQGMIKEGKEYSGCLYCGLMIKDNKAKVVEFNCRFGDPETQVVLPILKGDFLDLLNSSALGELDSEAVSYDDGSAVCVVAASGGYPDIYEKGFEITGLDNTDENIIVYHAGTKREDGKIVTNGGRVLGVTAVSMKNDLRYCKEEAYRALADIQYNKMIYRKDIADKALPT